METKHKKHLLITGLPRTGTTFLIAYYGKLGFHIGYSHNEINRIMAKGDKIHGGLELLNPFSKHKLLKETEIIKHPWCYGAKQLPWDVINQHKLEFDYIILTQRAWNLYAKSLANSSVRTKRLKGETEKEMEEKALKAAPLKMKQLESWINTTNSKFIKIEFPKSVEDFNYLWGQLKFTMKNIKEEEAYKRWLRLRNPDYVNFR